MNNNEDAPDWDRLPHEPAAFFNLPADFDRRLLRQSYNQLIRRYKPERHPQEFQRIRAAYEDLEQVLRYGLSAVQPEQPAEESPWFTVDLNDNDGRIRGSRPSQLGQSAEKQAAERPLHARLRSEAPAAVYQDCLDRSPRTAFHFYALAVLSDVVAPNEPAGFAYWLLQGLRAYPKESGLVRLLHHYVRGAIPDDSIDRLLKECARILHESVFFPLTEPLWERLLRGGDFPRFQRVLADCERHLPEIQIESRIAFFVRILRIAVWHADREWTTQTLRFIEENFQRIPRHLDFDVEILSALWLYVECRQVFAARNPVQQRLDQAVQDYFTKDQVEGDRSVLECQMLISQDVAAVAAAFAKFDDPTDQPFYALWWWVSRDVAARNVNAARPVGNEAIWRQQASRVLDCMLSQARRSKAGRLWDLSEVGLYLLVLFCYLISFVRMITLGAGLATAIWPRYNDNAITLFIVAGTVIGLAVGRWLHKRVKNRWILRRERAAEACYWEAWQPKLFEFAAQTHLPYQLITAYLETVLAAKGSPAQYAKELAKRDFGLALYAMSLHFLI
jgi:hypothetical protein